MRLLDYDGERHATLLERIGPSLRGFGLSVVAQIGLTCAVLRCAWEVPPPYALRSGAEKARLLAGFIAATWEELGRPCSSRVVERALAFAESRRAEFDPKSGVLVHGDAHSSNMLQAPGHAPAWPSSRLVDPDGLLAEPACDLAIPIRERRTSRR